MFADTFFIIVDPDKMLYWLKIMLFQSLERSLSHHHHSILLRFMLTPPPLHHSSSFWVQDLIHLLLSVLLHQAKRRTLSQFPWDKVKVQWQRKWSKKDRRQVTGLCFKIAIWQSLGCQFSKEFVRKSHLIHRWLSLISDSGWPPIPLISSLQLFFKMVLKWQINLQKD